MSTMGMQVELSMTAKGVQATLKDAQGAIVQTASILKSQLPAASEQAGQGIAKLKEGMGRARETAMFFTQSLGAFGETGRQVQGAVAGLAGAFMGGGGILLALTAAKTAVELLTAAWEADAKAAEEAGKKALQASKDIADSMAQVAKSEQDQLDGATYSKRTLLDRKYRDDLRKINQEIAESRKRTGDDIASTETKQLLEQRQRLLEEYGKAKNAIAGNAVVEQVNAATNKPKPKEEPKAKGWEKSFDQQVLEAEGRIKDEQAAADFQREKESREASWQMEVEDAKRRMQLEEEAVAAAKRVTAEWAAAGQAMGQAMGNAFGAMLTGAQTVSQGLKSILKAALMAVIDMALKQIDIAAIVAGAEAFKSQAGIPVVGPFLGAAAAAAVMATVHGMVGMISASGGADIGNYAPMAQLHPREMVLPAHIADPLRESLAGGGLGGGTVNLTVNAMDGKSVRRVLLDNGPALAEAIGRAARDGRRFG